MLNPEGDWGRMQRRRDNWNFPLIFGSIIFITVFLVILARGFRWF